MSPFSTLKICGSSVLAAAEIVYAEGEPPEVPSTSVMTDGCYRQVEYAGILAGTDQPEAAALGVPCADRRSEREAVTTVGGRRAPYIWDKLDDLNQ